MNKNNDNGSQRDLVRVRFETNKTGQNQIDA